MKQNQSSSFPTEYSRRVFGRGLLCGVGMSAMGALSTMFIGCAQWQSAQSELPSGGVASDAPTPLRVVATTTMLADLVQTIGGDAVICTALMGAGVDPHLYQPSAGDVQRMNNAQLVVYHGLHLEGQMGEVLSALSSRGKTVFCAGDALLSDDLLMAEHQVGDLPDPHIWLDCSLWVTVAVALTDFLAQMDDSHADDYRKNAADYLEQLLSMDQYICTRIASLPAAQRVLITAHDAFRYFGAAYSMQVFALQGISTEAAASAAQMRTLADLIVAQNIKAVFVENTVPDEKVQVLCEAVNAQGGEVALGGVLYAESLGDADGGHATLLACLKVNVDTIVEALGKFSVNAAT